MRGRSVPVFWLSTFSLIAALHLRRLSSWMPGQPEWYFRDAASIMVKECLKGSSMISSCCSGSFPAQIKNVTVNKNRVGSNAETASFCKQTYCGFPFLHRGLPKRKSIQQGGKKIALKRSETGCVQRGRRRMPADRGGGVCMSLRPGGRLFSAWGCGEDVCRSTPVTCEMHRAVVRRDLANQRWI